MLCVRVVAYIMYQGSCVCYEILRCFCVCMAYLKNG